MLLRCVATTLTTTFMVIAFSSEAAAFTSLRSIRGLPATLREKALGPQDQRSPMITKPPGAHSTGFTPSRPFTILWTTKGTGMRRE